VDDTRVDLSQFNEAPVALTGHIASYSPLQPDIIITGSSPEELEAGLSFGEESEGVNVTPVAESSRR